MRIKINEKVYKDKVRGCWLGKNAGGTLGGPLEARFSKEEMFDVSWYPELPEEGIPNDDLEIQLIWLQALQERGPGITSRDLAEYWLDCIVYNFDEYGLHKTNLNKGLMPPVSGWYNNWFKDCMGCPIRSEIWACIAPGAPEVAAGYAFEDSTCDHAGGESVYGEVFNAVVESSAFIIDDKMKLIEIGLNAISEDSVTHKAIRRTVELYENGTDWKETRNKIKDQFYSPISQYSPINLSFQTIGWLYGENFGDAICKAVNCGWDTDCTGATLGAILGIMMGAENLPKEWIEPLGTEISTNVQNGGIRNLDAPTDIFQLTDQVCELTGKILNYWNAPVEITETSSESSFNDDDYKIDLGNLLDYKPNVLNFDLKTLEVALEYTDTAALVGDKPTSFSVRMKNPHPEKVKTEIGIDVPDGCRLEPTTPLTMEIGPRFEVKLDYSIFCPDGKIGMSNHGTIVIKVDKRPGLLRVPLVFAGGFKYVVSPVFQGKSLEDDCGIDESSVFNARPKDWSVVWCEGNNLLVDELFKEKSGVLYFAHYIKSVSEENVIIGVPNNNRMNIWLNGGLLHETKQPVPLAPNESFDTSNYAKAVLKKGWNQVLIKLEKEQKKPAAHFLISLADEKHPINNGGALIDVIRSQFPWE